MNTIETKMLNTININKFNDDRCYNLYVKR